MREHATEPREVGSVALGILRMLPPEIQDDPLAASAVASIVGVLYRIAGFDQKE